MLYRDRETTNMRTKQMAEHKHGEMNTDVQEKTFAGFMKASAWVAGASVFTLIIMALFNS